MILRKASYQIQREDSNDSNDPELLEASWEQRHGETTEEFSTRVIIAFGRHVGESEE